jgi:hypothetical protein
VSLEAHSEKINIKPRSEMGAFPGEGNQTQPVNTQAKHCIEPDFTPPLSLAVKNKYYFFKLTANSFPFLSDEGVAGRWAPSHLSFHYLWQ